MEGRIVSACTNSNGLIRELRTKPLCEQLLSRTSSQASEESQSSKEANFKANFSLFTSLSTAEAQVFGVKFIGLYGTVGFIAIWDFFF